MIQDYEGVRFYRIKMVMEQVDLVEVYCAVRERNSDTCIKLAKHLWELLPLETKESLKEQK